MHPSQWVAFEQQDLASETEQQAYPVQHTRRVTLLQEERDLEGYKSASFLFCSKGMFAK